MVRPEGCVRPAGVSLVLVGRNAAKKFRRVDDYVVRRLRRLLIEKRGRNLRTGQVDQWTKDWFNGHGLYRLRGTICYPKAA